MLILSLALLACGGSAEPVVRRYLRPEGTSYPLARHIEDVAVLDVSPANRSTRAPDALPLDGPWTITREDGRADIYTQRLPYRLRFGPRGDRAPGLEVHDDQGGRLSFSSTGAPGTWGGSGESVQLRLPPGAPPPRGYRVVHESSRSREDALNLVWSSSELPAFVARTVTEGNASRTGLYLPAPSVASWDLVMPLDARFTADARLLASRLEDGQRSDGATVVVELSGDDGPHEVARVALAPGDWQGIDLDLSAWSGKSARLTLRSEAGHTNVLDYVFLGEPTIYTPLAAPRRMVVVVADTLRADHLGTYGYARNTSPWLDAWATRATVFTQVRSVAPWTLPAMRAALSGRYPDEPGGLSLVERLSKAGWVTVAFVDNAYMGAQFGMAEGWSWHHLALDMPSARLATNAANALAKVADRDLFVLVQTMDTHLPYTEPEPFRHLWAGAAPSDLPAEPWVRTDLIPLATLPPARRDSVSRHLVDRYDQGVRVVDDAVRRLFGHFGDDDVFVFFSDHGEEFLEHGSFEHGQSVFDEVVHVPLIVRAPGMAAGRVDGPVTLLDLAPTLLDLAGVDSGGLRGVSLASPQLDARLAVRSTALGFTLHGPDTWGLLQGNRKWVLSPGGGTVFDLENDPEERGGERLTGDWPEQLAATLQRPVVSVWRVALAEHGGVRPSALRLSAPDGFESAWMGLESPDLSPAVVRLEDGVVEVRPGESGAWPLEVFARPTSEGAAMEVSVEQDDRWTTTTLTWPVEGASARTVADLVISTTRAPLPAERALWGALPDGVEALRALGYLGD